MKDRLECSPGCHGHNHALLVYSSIAFAHRFRHVMNWWFADKGPCFIVPLGLLTFHPMGRHSISSACGKELPLNNETYNPALHCGEISLL